MLPAMDDSAAVYDDAGISSSFHRHHGYHDNNDAHHQQQLQQLMYSPAVVYGDWKTPPTEHGRQYSSGNKQRRTVRSERPTTHQADSTARPSSAEDSLLDKPDVGPRLFIYLLASYT